jgi:hypothetical protein
MGARPTHGGIVAALEGGGAGAFDSSAAKAQVERARPHVARAGVWEPSGRRSGGLLTHYTPRSSWPPGVTAMLGTFASVAMAQITDRARLELVCCHGTLTAIVAVMRRERGRAERAVNITHRAYAGSRPARRQRAWRSRSRAVELRCMLA